MTRDDDLALQVRMLVRTLNRLGQADTGPDAPTQTQQSVLAWLDELGPTTISALAGVEHVRAQSMGQTVVGLVERRWVSRRRDRGDRRRVAVALTPEGRIALRHGRSLRQAWLTEAIATELDPVEREHLAAGLAALERVVATRTRAERPAASTAAYTAVPSR